MARLLGQALFDAGVLSQGKNSVLLEATGPRLISSNIGEQLNRPKPCLKKREEASSLLMKPMAYPDKRAVRTLDRRRSIPSLKFMEDNRDILS